MAGRGRGWGGNEEEGIRTDSGFPVNLETCLDNSDTKLAGILSLVRFVLRTNPGIFYKFLKIIIQK